MATVSERSRKLMQRLNALSSTKQQESLIEQALLAERQNVWAEAALLVETVEINIGDHYGACYAPSADGALLASMLRAAAEKEVGKK